MPATSTIFLKEAAAIATKIEQLAAITEQSGLVTRCYGTEAFVQGAQLVASWMEAAGLDTRIDAIGNVRGVLVADKPDAPTFVIASHIDTVVNAGKFDGPLGVIMGIQLAAMLAASKQALPFNIEIIAFADEEGVRFHTTFLGSKVVTGAFEPALLQKTDAQGISLHQAIIHAGGQPERIAADAIASNQWLGYLEIHIEQGPVLYNSQNPVAIVSAIAGQIRATAKVTGFAGHAGTAPMNMRSDALCAAAEMVLAIEQYALQQTNLVATVGTLQIPQSASNVIPGLVQFSIDVRSDDEPHLARCYHAIETCCQQIAQKRNLAFDCQKIQQTPPVITHQAFNELLAQAIQQTGYPLIELVSGAGHDAVPVADVAPVTMLFVKCYKGISHHPLEHAEIADIAVALEVAYLFLQNLIHKYQ